MELGNNQQELAGDLSKSTANMQSYLNNKMIPKTSPGIPSPSPAPTPSTLGALAKTSADSKHPGLWANIRAKRARGGKPAKPGDEAYPDKKNWSKLTHKNAGEGSIPDIGAPHNAVPEGLGTTEPTSSHQEILNGILRNQGQPTPAPIAAATPKPTPFQSPVSTPHYPASQSAEGIPGNSEMTPNHANFLKEMQQMQQQNNATLPAAHPHIQQPAAVGQKLGSYLEALKKIAEKNVVMHKEDKNPAGGLSQKGRDKYNNATGSHLKAPVTQKNPKGEAKGRKASFCARMSGVKGPMKDEHGKPTRKALALRKWNCH